MKVLITILALILITAFMISHYSALVTSLTSLSSKVKSRPSISNRVVSITINGSIYFARRISPNEYLSEGLMFNDVTFIPLPVRTTGRRGAWFLVLYPDGASEVIQIYYACTGTLKHPKEYMVLGNHKCPRAGIMYHNGDFYLLVSKDCVNIAKKIVIEYVKNWIIMLIAPSNISLSNPRLLYKLIYVGETFSAASSWLPPTWCEVLVKDPVDHEVYLLERGLCPWIRVNNTYIMPGYTYSYWINLAGIAKIPGNYHIEAHVSCTFKVINYVRAATKTIHISVTLSMDLNLK